MFVCVFRLDPSLAIGVDFFCTLNPESSNIMLLETMKRKPAIQMACANLAFWLALAAWWTINDGFIDFWSIVVGGVFWVLVSDFLVGCLLVLLSFFSRKLADYGIPLLAYFLLLILLWIIAVQFAPTYLE